MNSLPQSEMESLFSYGTLQLDEVQLATFGRKLEGERDSLAGYRLVTTKLGHRNLQFTGNASDLVEGVVFAVTTKELEQSDAYEPAGYERERVQLASGATAWVYRSL